MRLIDMREFGCPIWEKQNLTIEEASEYSNIGEKRLRELCKNPLCDFVLYIGNRTLIKRKRFDSYIDSVKEVWISKSLKSLVTFE